MPDGTISFVPDGMIVGNRDGRIVSIGPWNGGDAFRRSDGIIIPAMFDNHTHISQFHIRGRFLDGVEGEPPSGRLIAGLERNVFPAEAKCRDLAYAEQVIQDFLADTLRHGVIGGAAYMTVHAAATRLALRMLPETWSVGLVLMNMNCPADLRTDEEHLDEDIASLANEFGPRFIVTDRFAPAVDSPLRRRASALAKRHGVRMQTHLNEQISEKQRVERELYPHYQSYTDVYLKDGLLDRDPILAHCVHMRDDELDILRMRNVAIAHCPRSNTHLRSGVMSLDRIVGAGLEYAICTDVGAAPTTSLLDEMAEFVRVHAGGSTRATPGEALFRTTLAAAKLLGLDDRFGTLAAGKTMSFAEIAFDGSPLHTLSADEVIRRFVLGGRVRRVTVRGQTAQL